MIKNIREKCNKMSLLLSFAIVFAVLAVDFCSISQARNIWFMPDENRGSFQLKTLRANEIRAPQAQGSPALTIYSHTLSGTISGSATNSSTLTGGTYTNPTITGTGSITLTGDTALTGNLAVDTGYFVSGVTKIDLTSGVTDALTDNYNAYMVELPANPALDSGVTLPAITASNDGMVVAFKAYGSGVSPFGIVVSDTDGDGECIECTHGTMTDRYCDIVDAAGDVIAWRADYNSGVTPTWRLEYKKITSPVIASPTITSPTITSPTITGTGSITLTGDVAITGNLTVGTGYFASGVTKFDPTSGVTDALTDDYNMYWVALEPTDLDSGCTLPAITAANDGMTIGFKHTGVSGVSPFGIAVSDPDGDGECIECARGTATAQYCDTIDAAGDLMIWQADYQSGVTPTWRLIVDEVS